MMSASAMSAAIRAKKKKMEDEKEAVKLSGIPEDAQDISVIKNHEAGEMLSENNPKERDEDPSLEAVKAVDASNSPHEESEPEMDLELGNNKKKDKIRSMLSRMGK